MEFDAGFAARGEGCCEGQGEAECGQGYVRYCRERGGFKMEKRIFRRRGLVWVNV